MTAAGRGALALALLCLGGCTSLREAMRGYAATNSPTLQAPPQGAEAWSDEEWGAFFAMHADFGTLTTDNLTTNAVPWKLVAALADVVPEPFYGQGERPWQVSPGEPLRRFGFIYRALVAGLPSAAVPQPDAGLPLGLVRGTARRSSPDLTLELAASLCTACHAGRGWDAEGRPTAVVYWGIPNHSLDFDGLIAAIAAAVLDPRATDAALLSAIARRFPAVAPEELDTYRRLLLPRLRKALLDSRARWGGLHPWRFGGPGMGHGAAILRDLLADDRAALGPADFPPASTKIPNVFGATAFERLLADGSYVSRPAAGAAERFRNQLIGFLPVLGTAPEAAAAEAPRLEKVRAFLDRLAPPPFPGRIDEAAAARGRATYRRRCLTCHGGRGEDGVFRSPGVLLPAAVIGTDPARAAAFPPGLARRFDATPIGEHMTLEPTGAYVAPSLLGVWANAPYLHNGSVPTLWHLLTPQARPARFWVGGHRLDLARVGIAEPADGELPWSEPRLVDTGAPGRSNRGHEQQVAGLAEEEKWDLIEFLKSL